MTDRKLGTTLAPPAQEITTANQRAFDDYASGVWIPLAQNLLGGLGVFTVIFVPLYLWTDAPGDWLMKLAGTFAALVFGLMCLVRFFSDEILAIVRAYGERQDRDRQRVDAQTIADLKQELAMLGTQDDVKSSVLQFVVAARLIREAYAGKPISREACAERGTLRKEWEAANRLLKAAGVVDDKSKLSLASEADAMAALLKATDDKRWGSYVTTPAGDMIRK